MSYRHDVSISILQSGPVGLRLRSNIVRYACVSAVTAHQRTDGSHVVDIYYDLASASGDTATVSIKVSADGGATVPITPASITGDVGSGVHPGLRRHVVWDAGADLPGAVGTSYRVQITASN